MKLEGSKKVFYSLLFAGLIFHAAICSFFYSRDHNQKVSHIYSFGEKVLDRLYSQFEMEVALKDDVEILLDEIVGLDKQEAVSAFQRWQKKNQFPKDFGELILFSSGHVLNFPANESDDWDLLMSSIDKGAVGKFRLEGPEKNRVIKLLFGGVGFESLQSKQGVIRRINRGPIRTFAAWKSNKGGSDGKVNSAILFINAGKFTELLIARHLIRKNSSAFGQIGYLDLFAPDNNLLPAGINANNLVTLVNSFDIKNKKGRFQISGKEIYLSVKPDGKILTFIPYETRTPIPFWTISLAFFWVPLLWRYLAGKNSGEIVSLKNLLILISLICIVFPAFLTTYYWKSFLETKRESIKIEYARKLEGFLIQLDEQHQKVLRQNKATYRDLLKIVDRKPQNLQKFIDESVRLELDMKLDSLLLVDENGNFHRPYTSSINAIRNLVFYPKPYRKRVCKEFFDLGWVPFDFETDYVTNLEPKDFNFYDYIGLSNLGQVTITSLGKMAGKDILQAYNKANGFVESDGKQPISSMVMGTFTDNTDENPIEIIRENLGGYVEFGMSQFQSRNYVDVVRDDKGKGTYCVIIWSASFLSVRNYLEELFARPHNWPESVQFWAISGVSLRLSFPYPDAWKRMENLLFQLQPPRNLLVDEIRINGVPHLRCAYAAKKSAEYIYVACVPISLIESKIQNLKTTLISGSILLLLTLSFVFWRLGQSLIEPARQLMKGVQALERRDHTYQIKLETGDEWEQLGTTFNSALEGIKELEVAHFVQTCILPAKDIIAAGGSFTGRTVPVDDVGGDYYDAFSANDGMVFIMGDVSGHSISAALVVNMAKAAFVALVDSGLYLPHEIFASMNSLMLDHLRRIKMMTCFAGFLSKNGELTYCNAGQAYPFLISGNGIETLKQVGYPLGAAKKKKFKFDTLKLPDKCRVVMFSDGVIEAMNDKDEPFGYDRLEEFLLELGHCMPRNEFIEAVYAKVKEFSGDVAWGDDVTVVVLDYERKPA